MNERLSGIYLILDAELFSNISDTLRLALNAGIRIFQYRDKRGCRRDTLQALHRRTQAAGALLFVNDAVELTPDADGLHVGQDDLRGMSISELRKQFPHALIGVSAHTVQQAENAQEADYLGVGPLHTTTSKQVVRPALEFGGLAEVVAASRLPVCAIGGIGIDDIPQLREMGIAMAAVIGAVAQAADQAFACRNLHDAWRK